MQRIEVDVKQVDCDAYHKVVASTLVWHRSKVLIVQHGRGRNRGRWNLPGGRVDDGETIAQAAMRETVEESGFRVALGKPLGVYEFNNRMDRSCARVVFFAKILKGKLEADGDEILDARWSSWKQLRKLDDEELCHPQQLRFIFSEIDHQGGQAYLSRQVMDVEQRLQSEKKKKKKRGSKKAKRNAMV